MYARPACMREKDAEVQRDQLFSSSLEKQWGCFHIGVELVSVTVVRCERLRPLGLQTLSMDAAIRLPGL